MTSVELHHECAGPEAGRALLFGGSLGTTLAMWEPQLAQLSSHTRVIRFDHRGHGGSPAPDGPYTIEELGGDVLALLDRLGLARASYCGLSIGGMVGQWLAINAPERIERLVLICTSAHLPPAGAWRQRAATVREARTPEVVADAVLARWFTEPYTRLHPEVVARYRSMLVGTAPEAYAGCCEAIAAMDLRAGLLQIAAPTLVIAGAQDPATPPEHGRAIAAAVSDARLEVLDGAAHLASVELATEVTDLIADHLNRREH
jgi:3-oxoadipate enol-lactonase